MLDKEGSSTAMDVDDIDKTVGNEGALGEGVEQQEAVSSESDDNIANEFVSLLGFSPNAN
jgi:hypothetical protein